MFTQTNIRISLIAVLLLVLAGCARVSTVEGDMTPVAGGCRGLELRPSWFSTGLAIACWDREGRQTLAAGTSGTAVVEVPLRVMGAAATFGGLYVLGASIEGTAGRIPTQFDITHGVDLPDASDFEGLRGAFD